MNNSIAKILNEAVAEIFPPKPYLIVVSKSIIIGLRQHYYNNGVAPKLFIFQYSSFIIH